MKLRPISSLSFSSLSFSSLSLMPPVSMPSLALGITLLGSSLIGSACGTKSDMPSASECADNPCDLVDSAATCALSDTAVAGYSCTCGAGYSDNGTTCVDVDDCAASTCADNDSAATCVDAAPPLTGVSCSCSAGYQDVAGTCVDIDGCAGNTCGGADTAATCADAIAPDIGFTCSCSDKFLSDGTTCQPKPCSIPPDVDQDGVAAYPWGTDLDDDGDGARTYLLGGRDINDADATITRALGNGSFSVVGSFAMHEAGSNPMGIVAGDFNDDGKLDLAITDQSGGTGDSGHVEVWLGDGAQGFTFASTPTLTHGGGRLSTGDFNNDGSLDLFDGGNVLLGSCDGNFAAVSTQQSRSYRSYVVDLNGDGNLDVIGTAYGTGIRSFLGAGDGSFSESLTPFTNSQDVAVGFLDGNTSIDIASSANNNGTGTNYTLKTFAQNTSGVLVEQSAYNSGGFWVDPVIGDVNNDGKSDVITHDFIAKTIGLSLGDGSGSVAAPTTILSGLGAPEMKVLVDVDGDGNRDLLFVDQTKGFASSRGDGNGGFGTPVFVTVGANPMALAVADFNKDGKLDAAVVNLTSGNVSILQGQ